MHFCVCVCCLCVCVLLVCVCCLCVCACVCVCVKFKEVIREETQKEEESRKPGKTEMEGDMGGGRGRQIREWGKPYSPIKASARHRSNQFCTGWRIIRYNKTVGCWSPPPSTPGQTGFFAWPPRWWAKADLQADWIRLHDLDCEDIGTQRSRRHQTGLVGAGLLIISGLS